MTKLEVAIKDDGENLSIMVTRSGEEPATEVEVLFVEGLMKAVRLYIEGIEGLKKVESVQ